MDCQAELTFSDITHSNMYSCLEQDAGSNTVSVSQADCSAVSPCSTRSNDSSMYSCLEQDVGPHTVSVSQTNCSAVPPCSTVRYYSNMFSCLEQEVDPTTVSVSLANCSVLSPCSHSGQDPSSHSDREQLSEHSDMTATAQDTVPHLCEHSAAPVITRSQGRKSKVPRASEGVHPSDLVDSQHVNSTTSEASAESSDTAEAGSSSDSGDLQGIPVTRTAPCTVRFGQSEGGDMEVDPAPIGASHTQGSRGSKRKRKPRKKKSVNSTAPHRLSSQTIRNLPVGLVHAASAHCRNPSVLLKHCKQLGRAGNIVPAKQTFRAEDFGLSQCKA